MFTHLLLCSQLKNQKDIDISYAVRAMVSDEDQCPSYADLYSINVDTLVGSQRVMYFHTENVLKNKGSDKPFKFAMATQCYGVSHRRTCGKEKNITLAKEIFDCYESPQDIWNPKIIFTHGSSSREKKSNSGVDTAKSVDRAARTINVHIWQKENFVIFHNPDIKLKVTGVSIPTKVSHWYDFFTGGSEIKFYGLENLSFDTGQQVYYPSWLISDNISYTHSTLSEIAIEFPSLNVVKFICTIMFPDSGGETSGENGSVPPPEVLHNILHMACNTIL